MLISEPDGDYISADIAEENRQRNKNKWKSNHLNPVTMQCQLQEYEWHLEAEKSSYTSCAPEMTPLACQLLRPASSHFLLCCLRTWHVLADVIHKTMSLSGSLSTAPLPLCSGVLWELGPWRPGSSREGCQRGQCILKNNTQPLKPPGTKLCNNWLVQPCDLITVSQGFQRKLKGVKHPLDPASDHLKSSPFSFVLLSSCFTFARGGISP